MSCYSDQNSFLHYIDEKKLFSFITLVTFGFICVFIYILKSYTFFEKRGIPSSVTPSAPFGNIKDVLFQESTLYVHLWKYYNRFKRKGFRFGGLYLLFKPSVLVVNPRLTEKIISEEKCLVGVSRDDTDCKSIVAVFNDDILERLIMYYNDNKCSSMGDLKDECITTVLHNFFMETLCSSFGFKNSLEIFDTINSLLKDKISSTFLHHFYLVYPIFKLKKSTSGLQDYLKRILEFRKKNDIKEKDIIDGFSDLLNTGTFSLEILATELFDLFTDNIIHAYSTLLFCLYELVSNDDVQQEVIGEIKRFRNENNQVTLKNLQQLTLLDLVVKETLRKYPPVPVVTKKCKEDYKIADFDLSLPKGTLVFVSIFGIHYDADNFPDPEKFDPYRFSDKNMGYIKPNTYAPFGYSLRKDIGLHFTTVLIKLGLLSILSSYKVTSTNNQVLKFDAKKIPVYPDESLSLSFESLL